MRTVERLKPEYDPLNALYKLEEDGKKFYLPLKSLELLEKYFDSFVPTSKHQFPTVISWYNTLSRAEQADILVMNRLGGGH
ncbi:MAG TPA: hypothetical protein VD993_20810 [Chitinophagaceae bacterium]|nr:hypothetical protein [Chitinophagaceae bacterium]